MSYRIRPSAMSSLFGSNHFVIAACAAIAMVLGAMSVGASVSETNTPQQASLSSTTISTNSGSTRLRTDERSSGLTPQHTLEPKLVLQPSKATAEKLKGATKVQYQLNELLTPVASSLFIDQTSLLNELQAQASTSPLNTVTGNGITAPVDNAASATNPDAATITPQPDGSTSSSPTLPAEEQPTPPETPSDGGTSIFSGDVENPPLLPTNP